MTCKLEIGDYVHIANIGWYNNRFGTTSIGMDQLGIRHRYSISTIKGIRDGCP